MAVAGRPDRVRTCGVAEGRSSGARLLRARRAERRRVAAACRRRAIDACSNLAGGLAAWTGPREFGPGVLRGPSPWLIENADLLPRGGKVLDVACGRGRHALLLASAGFEVHAIDRNPRRSPSCAHTAERLGLQAQRRGRRSRNRSAADLGERCYDAVLVFNYLHRPLMPALRAALKPGGRIFYETFTTRQAERGHPSNPAFLLKDGELAELMAPFTHPAIARRRDRRPLHCVGRRRAPPVRR